MAHAQTPDFVFREKRASSFKSAWSLVQSITGSRRVRISGSNGSNVGYTMFRGGVTGTGYPLHSPVSPSLPLPCVTVCHHVSPGLYLTLYLLLVLCHCVHCLLQSLHCLSIPHTMPPVGSVSLCPLLSSIVCPLADSNSHCTVLIFCATVPTAVF